MKPRLEFQKGHVAIVLEKEWFNYVKLSLYFPRLHLRESSPLERDLFKYGLKLSTQIIFTKAFGFSSFEVIVLGFGVSVARQRSY